MNNVDPGDTSGDVLAILQEQLESRNKTTVVVESTVLIIFNIVALVGNAILCFIPDGNPKLLSSTTMLIVALACTDLLTTANVMPLTIDAVINSFFLNDKIVIESLPLPTRSLRLIHFSLIEVCIKTSKAHS